MPIISRFFGIVIFMFWREHRPPHFHAKYGDDEVVIEIESGKVSGTMIKRALALVQEWRQLHGMNYCVTGNWPNRKKPCFP